MRRLLREPLLHFVVLGAVLFALYSLLNRDALRSPDEIVVNEDRIAALGSQFERVWQRPPTPEELGGLVDNWVREEMLYREGLALGFETDDPVIRRRVVQKVTFMTEALVDEATSETELEHWLAEHPERYRIEPRISFRQVYVDPGRHGDALDAVLEGVRAGLASDPGAADTIAGDTTLLPGSVQDRSRSDVSRTFGEEFTAAVFDLPTAEWSGPIRSGFGLHFVRVAERAPGRQPALADVRADVERDLLAARRDRAQDAFLESLRDRYTVRDTTRDTTGRDVPRAP
ncbi:MAG TPA: peptidylprolyl isomerase [Woeseiaceae bacterium]|nr:peptidylprolyl isomerase [Woeseiaceae bacterium]